MVLVIVRYILIRNNIIVYTYKWGRWNFCNLRNFVLLSPTHKKPLMSSYIFQFTWLFDGFTYVVIIIGFIPLGQFLVTCK